MSGALVSAVLILVAAGYVIARIAQFLSQAWFLGVLWRFLTGVSENDRVSRGRLAGRRWAGVSVAFLLVSVFIASPGAGLALAGATLAAGVAAGGAWLFFWAVRFRHRRTWLRPAHLAACDVAEIPRGRAPKSWLEVERDRSRVVAQLPPGWPADDKDKTRLVSILTAKLGMESTDPEWRLAGPKPTLTLTVSQPPPARVPLADIRPVIDRVRADDLVWGLGKRGQPVTTSLSGDSPHVGLSMGSGAGKSVTARALLAQMLYRGCIGLILDYKMISHQWAAGLPNVAIARRPHEIHRALLWLGAEAERRNEVALAAADMDGNVHAVVGPRLIVICEELNATVARLRAFWRAERDGDRDLPQRSPALDALDAVSFMGRQVLMNVVYIGQRLSVKASGGDGDARENIGVVAFGRYSASNWKMLAPDFPMPPKSLAPGRIQVVAGTVRETQAAFTSAREARDLATAGTVALLPAGMPGAPRVPAGSRELVSRPDVPFVAETRPHVPAGLVTLSEAVSEGIVSCTLHAVRKAAQRDDGFPRRAGMRGLAGEYDPLALAEWDAGRR